MKKILFIFIFCIFFACTFAQKPETIAQAYDHIADIKLFLSTTDQKVEEKVIERLKSNDIDHSQIKLVLQTMLPTSNIKHTGLHPNLKFKMNKKVYSYALYVPESVKPNMPMIVVMHGMGGNGANTIPAWVKRLRDEFVIVCPTYPMGAWWSKNAEEFILKLIN